MKRASLPLKKFYNTSGVLYKTMALKDKIPTMSEDEQLKLLATDGMLVEKGQYLLTAIPSWLASNRLSGKNFFKIIIGEASIGR